VTQCRSNSICVTAIHCDQEISDDNFPWCITAIFGNIDNAQVSGFRHHCPVSRPVSLSRKRSTIPTPGPIVLCNNSDCVAFGCCRVVALCFICSSFFPLYCTSFHDYSSCAHCNYKFVSYL